jgi:CheY-like chemotaxis protein
MIPEFFSSGPRHESDPQCCALGCCGVAARSCDEALIRLAENEAGRRPDVIVCDYQLSRGAAGVDAIERLRRAFPSPPSPRFQRSSSAAMRALFGARSAPGHTAFCTSR